VSEEERRRQAVYDQIYREAAERVKRQEEEEKERARVREQERQRPASRSR